MVEDILLSSPVEKLSGNPKQTRDVGRCLGELAEPGDVILLIGDLGAGKTCLTQGILWGLGSTEYVRSPTFVLIAEYKGRLPISHIDLFRLESARETLDLGLDEYFEGDGLCVVEWADRAEEYMPDCHLSIRIDTLQGTVRKLKLTATSPSYNRFLENIRD